MRRDWTKFQPKAIIALLKKQNHANVGRACYGPIARMLWSLFFQKGDKKMIKKSFAIITAVLFFIGCASLTTELRKSGFDKIQKSFNTLENTPDLYEIIELKNVKIYIVGSREFFELKSIEFGFPIAAYSNSNNKIYVLGKIVKGKIVLNQAILGHELNHLLNFKNPKIANPDKLDDLGA